MTFAKYAITSATILIASGLEAQDTFELTLSHFFPEAGGSHNDAILPWVEELEKRSEGRISVTIRGRESWLGDIAQQFDQAKNGLSDIALGVTAVPRGRFNCTQIVEIPFFVQTSQAADRLLLEMYPDHIGHEYEDVKLIGLWAHDPGVLVTRGVAVEKPEDLEGLRIGFPTPFMASFLSDLGAEPVILLPRATQAAFENGEIDGAYVPWERIWISGLGGPDTNVLDLGAFTVPLFLIMNNAVYDKMPDDLQEVVDSVSLEAWFNHNGETNRVNFWGEDQDAFHDNVREKFVADGGAIITPNEALTQLWFNAADATVAALETELVQTCGQDIVDAAHAFIGR